METRARKRKRLAGETQEAIPGLPDDIVVTHILRYDYFDAAERARLQSVSRGMRDAVAAKVGRLVLVITRHRRHARSQI